MTPFARLKALIPFRHSPLKVAVLGTSNTVAAWGYYPHLAKSDGLKVERFALGGSSSFVAILFLDAIIASRPDVCVIELAVNDATMTSLGETHTRYIEQTYRFLITRLRAAGITPLILVMPHLDFITASPVRDIIRTVAKDLTVDVLDGYDLVTGLTAGGALASAFTDKSHITAEVSLTLAGILAERVKGLNRRPIKPLLAPIAYRYQTVDSLQTNGEVISLSTSLFTGQALIFEDMATAEVDLAPDEHIVAIAFDMCRSTGSLAFSGQTETIKALYNRYVDPDPSALFACVVALRQPVAGENGRVRLSLADAGDMPEDRNAHYIRPVAPLPEARVALFGLVIARNPAV
jgi:hypothetical protein